MNNIRVLLVDQNADARFELKRLAQKAGADIVGEVGLGTEAVSTAAELQPDVVICGMSKPAERTMQTIESLLDVLPEAPIIAYDWGQDVDIVRRAMLAGARDFIVMPTDPVRLRETLRMVLESQDRRRERASGETKPKDPRGFVVSVFAAKGGVGKSTVATNVAVALSGRQGESVVLLDADDSFGDIAAMLDLDQKRSLVEFLRDIDTMQRDEVTAHLAKHSCGLYVLPGPAQPLAWRSIAPADVHRVVGVLSRRFDVAVIDTGAMLTDVTLAVLEESDLVLWITSPDFTSINNSILGLEALTQLSYPKERIRIVLNSVSGEATASTEKMQAALGEDFWWQIPYDPEIRTSTQAGHPAVLAAERGRGATSMRDLAGTLMGETPLQEEGKKSPLRKLLPWRARAAQSAASGK